MARIEVHDWTWSKKIDPLAIIEFARKYPNDMELGKELRKYINSFEPEKQCTSSSQS